MQRVKSLEVSSTVLGAWCVEMSKIAVVLLFTLLASPAWATSYFLATAANGGSDSNNGKSASTPWLTPNHPLNCGDVIFAAPSAAYAASNFTYNNWGTVTCTAGSNVAWLKCSTFDACKISVGAAVDGFDLDTSYWGVQGWEVDGTVANAGTCFFIYNSHGISIHHIIFANDIANGCGQSGFTSNHNGSSGVDYIAYVGNIAYNTAGTTLYCSSGLDIYEPVASDNLPGTHLYMAGNFVWNVLDGAGCSGSGSLTTDGEGLFFDTIDGSQSGLPVYTNQAVIDNNISVFNGGRGVAVYNNSAGTVHAPIYVRHNTTYGNETDANQTDLTECGDISVDTSSNVQALFNLSQSASTNICQGGPIYAYYVASGNSSDRAYSSFGYNSSGNNTGSASSSGSGFSFGPNNVLGTNPVFSNPTDPGAPSCGSASGVSSCMATVIANFTPTNASAVAYGYQKPSITPTYDPLFPQWLCNVNLPAGLVTMGCLALHH